MYTTDLVKYAGALVALAMCAACGGAAPLSWSKGQSDMALAPSGAALNATYVGRTLFVNGRPVTAARVNLSRPPRYAPTVPDRHSKAPFEYVIGFYGTYASIFRYPKSVAQSGTINNVGGQGCTNVLYGYGKKIVWIVAAYNQITEYEVPKKPIKTLSDTVGQPSSCAMNSKGDLAVGILSGTGQGDVVIFKHARGSGKIYATPLGQEFFDGYDVKGNLFADGYSTSGFFELVELPKGSTKFETIATSNTVGFPGSVQWDGKYVTVLDQSVNEIYRYTVSGTNAKLKGTVTLKGAADCAQGWIVQGLVYCGDASNNDGEVFKYPAGGSIVATFTGNFATPLGVVAAAK